MNTVLHVDTSEVFRVLIRDRFMHHGWRYLSADSTAGAMEALERNEVQLIITALELSGAGGEEFIVTLADSPFRDIPVAVMSSTESLEIRKRLYDRGIMYFIPKMIKPDRLVGCLDRLIREDEVSIVLRDLRIAVLDDSEAQRDFIAGILRDRGIGNASFFERPTELLADPGEYGVFIVDIILPEMSGDQVIYELRARHRNSVIIAISTIDHVNTVSTALSSGADDYLLKPFGEGVFMARLKSNLRTYLLLEKLEEKNRELAELAVRDGLTRLFNHRYLYERLSEEIEKAKRYIRRLSVAMFDIDHFKRINDTCGHRTGDAVLCTVAETIRGCLRDTDILGRYGGEEFFVIYPETGLGDAAASAERIRVAVSEARTEGWDEPVTVSAGVLELKNENLQDLVEEADRRLYRAKEEGRNRVVAEGP
ncbi:MAG: diguanylate cyclase [Spirochaetes bacterium]|nr:diguanylate cyclase [Spirochaetota bacterium]